MGRHTTRPMGLSMFTLSLGAPFGIPTRVHWSFWLLVLWFAGRELMGPDPSAHAAAWSALFILSLFACVGLHEFGHALAARAFGIHTRSITLLPFGGVALLEGTPWRPSQELVVALAGPAVNLALAPPLIGLAMVMGLSLGESGLSAGSLGEFLALLAIANIILLVFNLLPAFPLDGGRALRAVLCMFLPRGRASRIAAALGQGFAVVFAGVGLWMGNFLLVAIAILVFLASRAEAARYAPPTPPGY